MRRIVLIVNNVRSAHNVGSMFRTADGLGIEKVCLCGYTPYPMQAKDLRLPHIARGAHAAIAKTALGAQDTVCWEHYERLSDCLLRIRSDGFSVVALEQTPEALDIGDYRPDGDVALVVGNEVEGLGESELKKIGTHVMIPMLGEKESFNVAVAAAMALYSLRYLDKRSG